MSWRETRTTIENKDALLAEGSLAWGEEIPIPIPEGLISYELVVTQFDGREYRITDNSPLQGWVSADVYKAAGILTVSPQALQVVVPNQQPSDL